MADEAFTQAYKQAVYGSDRPQDPQIAKAARTPEVVLGEIRKHVAALKQLKEELEKIASQG